MTKTDRMTGRWAGGVLFRPLKGGDGEAPSQISAVPEFQTEGLPKVGTLYRRDPTLPNNHKSKAAGL